MAWLGINMDGIQYRVRIVYDTYADSFQLIEGPAMGDMLSDRHERDLIGTKATYEMGVEPDPLYPEDFDAFYESIRSPVNTHRITVFDGQQDLTYDAMITAGRRVFKGILSGVREYAGSVIQFVPVEPQWEAT